MKKLLLFIFSLLFIIVKANEPKTNLVIWIKDGAKVTYALAEKPKITFTKNELIVNTTNVEIKYDLKNILRFSYEGQSANITDLESVNTITIHDDALVFPSLSVNSTIFVYSIDGTLVLKKTVLMDDEYVLPLSNFNTGLYIVNVNELKYKFWVK